MPVDEGFVDPDAAGDMVDTGVLASPLIEQSAGRADDLALAGAAPGGARFLGRGHG